jgi:hypothetical protein
MSYCYPHCLRYGVDWQTAFTELEMLGVPIDPEYKKCVLQSEEAQLAARRRKKAEREAELWEQVGLDQDEHPVGWTIQTGFKPWCGKMKPGVSPPQVTP